MATFRATAKRRLRVEPLAGHEGEAASLLQGGAQSPPLVGAQSPPLVGAQSPPLVGVQSLPLVKGPPRGKGVKGGTIWGFGYLELLCLLLLFVIASCTLVYFDELHSRVHLAYSHLGYSSAQHALGQRYLQGLGLEKSSEEAHKWFRRAAEQGHPHASYRVAMERINTHVEHVIDTDAHKLLSHAASQGLPHAQRTLQELCQKGRCPTADNNNT
nr:secretory immunoglobulin A-binding protein EsiB-like [Petromyzon marinus]